jgi:hypothetical protein
VGFVVSQLTRGLMGLTSRLMPFDIPLTVWNVTHSTAALLINVIFVNANYLQSDQVPSIKYVKIIKCHINVLSRPPL